MLRIYRWISGYKILAKLKEKYSNVQSKEKGYLLKKGYFFENSIIFCINFKEVVVKYK